MFLVTYFIVRSFSIFVILTKILSLFSLFYLQFIHNESILAYLRRKSIWFLKNLCNLIFISSIVAWQIIFLKISAYILFLGHIIWKIFIIILFLNVIWLDILFCFFYITPCIIFVKIIRIFWKINSFLLISISYFIFHLFCLFFLIILYLLIVFILIYTIIFWYVFI